MQIECWIDVKGYEGLYQVSNTQKVRSLAHMRVIKGAKQFYPMRELKPTILRNGYRTFSFYKGGVKETKLRHRLVAEAFKRKPVGKDFVNHKNGKKWDDRPSNLEWCTRSENMLHAIEMGLCVPGCWGRAKAG